MCGLELYELIAEFEAWGSLDAVAAGGDLTASAYSWSNSNVYEDASVVLRTCLIEVQQF